LVKQYIYGKEIVAAEHIAFIFSLQEYR